MKPLIAIMTCHRKSAWADAQRHTWVKDVVEQGYADVKFFLGYDPLNTRPFAGRDEVWLFNVPDDYRGIPLKVQAICRWATENGYERVGKCDDDVYVVPDRLPHLPFASYVGRFREPYGSAHPVHFASGFMYWLDRKAASVVADTPWNGDWMDERFVASSLAHHGIFGQHDPVNYVVSGPHLEPFAVLSNDALRKGTAFCEYGPAKMHAMHLAMRSLRPVYSHPGLVQQPEVVMTAEMLAARPTDDIPKHKLDRSYFVN